MEKYSNRSWSHEGWYGQALFNQGPFGKGQEGDPGLAPHSEPLLLKITPQAIQEGGNTKEAQQDHKTPPSCRLIIWKFPQEAVEYQRQTLRRVNPETLGDHTRAMNSINQMVSAQSGLIPQVTGDLNHAIFWEATILVYHYSE